MASIIHQPRWTVQPPSPWLDRSHPLMQGVSRVMVGTPGSFGIEPAKGQAWVKHPGTGYTFVSTGEGFALVTTSGAANYLDLTTITPPAAGWTMATIATPTTATPDGPCMGFYLGGSFEREIEVHSTFWAGYFYDGSAHELNSTVVPQVGRFDVVVCTQSPTLASVYVNGLEPTTLGVSTSGFQGYATPPTFSINNPRGGGTAANWAHSLVVVVNRPWSRAEAHQFMQNPWQIFRPHRRVSYRGFTAVGNPVGGGLETLRPLTETGGGTVGFAARTGAGLETLRPVTQLGGGTVASAAVNLTGGGLDTLQDITVSMQGGAGALTGAVETLQALASANQGGTVAGAPGGSGGIAILRHITETGGGKAGAMIRPIDASHKPQSTLRALQCFAGGFSAAPALGQPQQGGAPAWWGYEGQAGSRGRPWWYSDLKDKARELERLRKVRIDLGILPAPENKKIKKIVKQTKEFADEHPTPATAEYYVAREEQIRAKVEEAIARLDEEDDERVIMEMSKFFFPRKSAEHRAWNH